MLGIATGAFTVIRGEEEANEYGDIVDSLTPVHTGVVGAVTERTRQNFNPEGVRIGTYRELVGRFSSDADIQDGDRLLDEDNGNAYVVSGVRRGSSLMGSADLVLDLTAT